MYNQLLKLLDKSEILKISRENGGERYTKRFNAVEKHCYIHSDFYRTPINIILLLIASNYFEGVGVCAYYDVYYMLGVIITRD